MPKVLVSLPFNQGFEVVVALHYHAHFKHHR